MSPGPAATACSARRGPPRPSSTAFSDPGANFHSSDVGKTIVIQSAGGAGTPLNTTIAGYTSPTQITLGAAATTSLSGNANYSYGTTSAAASCTGLAGLGLLAPMIESLSDPVAAAVSGTGPGGAGGNETWLGWSGENNYFQTTGTTYSGDYILPSSGPNTTGGCPVGGLCSLAQSEGAAPYYGTDPQGTCPPTQAEANAGFVDCSIALLTANQNNASFIASSLDIAYANDPTPATPTATVTPSSGLSPGDTVTVTNCNSCNWWGSGANGAPGYVNAVGQSGSAVAIPAPTVWVGATRASAVAAPTSSVKITPASYGCAASGGAATTNPGPVATCILGTSPVTGSTGTTTASSTAFSDANAQFYAADVGKKMVIQGAGVAGATLTTTIASVVDSTDVTLGTAASTAIAGSALYTYGSLTTEGTTGHTTAASTAFTDANANFTSADVGKTMAITGAGPSGAPLDTSIAGFTSATAVTLATAASTTVSGTATYSYGSPGTTGTTTATSTAFSDPHGSFASADVGKSILIPGAGPSGTTLITTIAGYTSATAITLGTAASVSLAGSAIYSYGTPSQGTVKGTFTVPTGAGCTSNCNVYIDEPNLTMTQGTYSGGGSYNVGLSYNLVNAVESSTPLQIGGGGATVTNVNPSRGPLAGGNQVTITGTGFTGTTGATGVTFGGTDATSYTVNSDTSITATVPGPPRGRLGRRGGQRALRRRNPHQRLHLRSRRPRSPTSDPSRGPLTGGNQVTITGTNFTGTTGATRVTFGGTNATSYTVSSATPSRPPSRPMAPDRSTWWSTPRVASGHPDQRPVHLRDACPPSPT